MDSDGKLRLLRLLELLQTESDEQHPISIAEITKMMKERWSDKHGKVAAFRVDRIFETPKIVPEKGVPIWRKGTNYRIR